MKIYLSHSSNFDYQTNLYEPLKKNFARKYAIFYPHDSENINTKSKSIIAESDYVLAEVTYPSTGQGIELGWAEAQSVPIICIYRKGADYSKSLNFVSDDFVQYENTDELVIKLEKIFSEAS